MNWSIDGQTPEFLAATRMISLSAPIVDAILSDLKLAPGMRVLDVGCGSGEYCFRLGSALEGVSFTGLEYDAHFVDFASARARGEVGYPFEAPNPASDYQFVCGDGLDLPFSDGSFDAVISHTYLTALPDWACALAEMCRVCKPGGTVSSVTSLTDNFYGTGTIELFSGLLEADDAGVLARVGAAKAALFGDMALAPGIAPRKAPVAFDWIGLERVHCMPIGQYFCLSDANIGADEYARYVDLLCEMERKQLERLSEALRRSPGWELPGSVVPLTPSPPCEHMPGQPDDQRLASAPSAESKGARTEPPIGLHGSDLLRYAELIEERRDFLLGSIGANREWNWFGNSSLLVSGTVPAGGLAERCAPFSAANHRAQELLEACRQSGRDVAWRMEQLGPGRCVKAEFTIGSQLVETVCGFDPPSALEEGCAKIAAGPSHHLAALEQRFLDEERKQTSGTLPNLPALLPERVFSDASMWETVSEAALSGLSVQFKDAGMHSGLHTVACVVKDGKTTACAIACHTESVKAAQRALARALGKING